MDTPFKYYDIIPVEDFCDLKREGILLLEAVWLKDGQLGVAYVPSDLVEDYKSQLLQDQAQLGIAENILHCVNSRLKNGTFRVKGGGEVYILDTLSMVRRFDITRYSLTRSGITFMFDGAEYTATLI